MVNNNEPGKNMSSDLRDLGELAGANHKVFGKPGA